MPTAVRAITSWLLLQAVASFESCYKLSAVLTCVASCRHIWQLFWAVASFWQLLQAVAWIFDSNSKGQLIHSSTRLWHPFQKVVSESVTDMCRLWSDLGAIKTKSTKPSQMTTYPVLTLRSEMLRTIPVIGSTFPDTVTLKTINHTSVEICMGKQEEYCCCLWIKDR